MSRKRCAIYTRKSTDEGLDQSFNSLDAQREACEAYVTSQRHEGWSLVRKAYDDGGFSGGSMERPALLLLLNDIRAGLVDVVVVYKIDRLTRSLADFAKMVEVFDAKGVSFVSVTQQFNTTTSMGRLTLNVLLSFAQFEREVTAERIRDKIAASRKKGMWMGGPPPLGYDVRDKKLVVNQLQAEQVRKLFRIYLELCSIRALTAWAGQNGITTKVRMSPDGTIRSGGKTFSRGNLHALLRYRTYIGEVQHQGKVYPGEQEAVIPAELWDQVQAKILEGRSSDISIRHEGTAPALAGLVFDETGDRLTPTHATKKGRRYHYYVSSRLIEKDAKDRDDWRMPAHKLEQAVRDCLLGFLSDKVVLLDALSQHDGNLEPSARAMNQTLKSAREMIEKIQSSSQLESIHEVRSIVARIELRQSNLKVTVRLDKLLRGVVGEVGHEPSGRSGGTSELLHTIEAPLMVKRRGVETHLIIGSEDQATANVDEHLVRIIAKARGWFETLLSKPGSSINMLAEREGIPASEVSRRLPLAFLSPQIVRAVLQGQQPIDLTATSLLRLPTFQWTGMSRLSCLASATSDTESSFFRTNRCLLCIAVATKASILLAAHASRSGTQKWPTETIPQIRSCSRL